MLLVSLAYEQRSGRNCGGDLRRREELLRPGDAVSGLAMSDAEPIPQHFDGSVPPPSLPRSAFVFGSCDPPAIPASVCFIYPLWATDKPNWGLRLTIDSTVPISSAALSLRPPPSIRRYFIEETGPSWAPNEYGPQHHSVGPTKNLTVKDAGFFPIFCLELIPETAKM